MKSTIVSLRVLFVALTVLSPTCLRAQSGNYQNYDEYADEYAPQDNLYTDYSTKQQQKLAPGGGGGGGGYAYQLVLSLHSNGFIF